MEETLDIILSATDNASDTFESVAETAENMGESLQGSTDQASQGFDEVEESASAAEDPISQIGTLLEGFVGAEVFTQLADALWDMADKAGTFEDSLMRARLEAEGAGIDVNAMTDAVSELSTTTGRAGSEIRESFIKATARGITDLDSFKKMMEGAGAQATLLGTDIQTMADKYSGFASRSRVMEKALANTGITVEELGEALGITGATIDDVNAKWETMTEDQRAAALGMAATMNEGQTANEEYKKSWAGLQAQIDIAKGRIERLAGEVLLPVLIPALQVASRVLNWLGDAIDALVNGPFGGLVSIIGASAAAFALAVPAYMAVQGAITLLTATAIPAATALWAMVAPLAPFIILGAAVAYAVYSIGKAFGWWTDVTSMLDAVYAGVQRLWSAFINHPDVQGFINGISAAWKAMQPYINLIIKWVKSFFKVSGKRDFDLVRTLINAIGTAWRAVTTPIRLVISVMHSFYNTVKSVISKAKATIQSLNNISLSGLTNRLTQPFTNAYNRIAREVEKIKAKASSITNLGGILSFGFDYEGMMEEMGTGYSTGGMSIDHNINLSVDLANVPSGVDTATLVDVLTSREVLAALTGSSDFQSLDSKAKNRLALKNGRARGA